MYAGNVVTAGMRLTNDHDAGDDGIPVEFLSVRSRPAAPDSGGWLGDVMGTSCQAGERNPGVGRVGAWEGGADSAVSTTLFSRHRCRRGIYQHSAPKGCFLFFVLAPMTLSQT